MNHHPFQVGDKYTRKDVFKILDIEDPGGGSWYTGHTPHGDDIFIFCGVGVPGRTGHDYHNHFVGDVLVWYGKTNTKLHQPAIQRLLNPAGSIYLFYREDNRDPFTFAGLARAIKHKDTSPVEIHWRLEGIDMTLPERLPQEIGVTEKVFEGAKKTVTVNTYERDPAARQKCIDRWGVTCRACGFDFQKTYGELGKGFIHVHHLKPLSEIGEAYELDATEDLRPVCPNCHAMLHRKIPALSIEELMEILRQNGGS